MDFVIGIVICFTSWLVLYNMFIVNCIKVGNVYKFQRKQSKQCSSSYQRGREKVPYFTASADSRHIYRLQLSTILLPLRPSALFFRPPDHIRKGMDVRVLKPRKRTHIIPIGLFENKIIKNDNVFIPRTNICTYMVPARRTYGTVRASVATF